MQPRNPRVDDGFDDDLKRALEMSLEEVKGHSGAGYVPQSQSQPLKRASITNGTSKLPNLGEGDEDAELKAAIAASLQDMEEQKKNHARKLKEQASNASTSNGPKPVIPKPGYELSLVEAENINLFSTLVDRLQHQPPGTVLREPQIQELYDSIGTLRPKLARTYGETMSKHGRYQLTSGTAPMLIYVDTLLDLHSKLATVVRYYDRMLEERLSHTYGQHTLGSYGSHPPRTSSNIYPSIPTNIASGSGGAESFYTGNPASSSDGYGYSNTAYDVYPPTRSPQLNYSHGPLIQQGQPIAPTYSDPNQSGYKPQRIQSVQNYPQTPTQRNEPSYFQDLQAQGYPPQVPSSQQTMQSPQTYSTTQQPVSPLRESNSAAAYYQANQNPNGPPAVEQTLPSTYSSADQYAQQQPPNQYPPQQQPYQTAQPQQTYPQQPQQQHYPPQQSYQAQLAPQQDQRQQLQHFPQSQAQTMSQPNVSYSNPNQYTQDSFPSAPHHNPQPKAVEESLIEL